MLTTKLKICQSAKIRLIGMKMQKVFIVLIVLFFLIALFAPIPMYQSEDFVCKMGQTNCPKKGWHLGSSLWQKISGWIEKPVSAYPKYGYSPDYSWIAGRIEYYDLEGGCYSIIFSNEDSETNYHGKLSIQPQSLVKEKGLKEGDFVILKGKIGKPKFSMACYPINYEVGEILFH